MEKNKSSKSKNRSLDSKKPVHKPGNIQQMQVAALNKKGKKSSLETLQSTFNQLRRKIDQLRRQLEIVRQKCEQSLAFYHSELKPHEKKTGDLVAEFILKVKDITSDPKALNKKEKKILEEIIADSVNIVFSLLPLDKIPDDLKGLYKDIHGKSIDEDFQEGLSSLKDMFKEHTGIDDIDFSNFDPNDNPQEILRKFMESLEASMKKEKVSPSQPSKQKSKKELLKEQKARDLETLQNKGLNSIYKRLVKELHPDLEQDPVKRVEKDTLMKRLTVAYENQDLVSLLALESEWLGGVDRVSEALSEENFKAYNSLLKDQIEDLKDELRITSLHPRYIEIHKYIEDCPENPLEGVKNAFFDCDSILEEYSQRLDDLSGKNPLIFLKKALAAIAKQSEEDEELPSDLELLYLLDHLNELMAVEPPRARKKKKAVKKKL